LIEAIQKLGKPAEDLLRELQNIESNIALAFQEDPEGVFDNFAHYYEQLSRLETQLDRFASQAERDFNQLQEQYRELFIQNTGLSGDRLWRKIFYSANNANGVYNNLYSAVEKQVTGLLDDLYGNIDQSSTTILTLSTIPTETYNDIEDDLHTAQQSLKNIDDDYTRLTETVDHDTLQNVEKFRNWLEYFGRTSKKLRDINSLLQQLREKPHQSALSSEQKALIDAVSRSELSGSLIRIRHELSSLSDDDFWRTLRELWERRIIELNVKSLD
jgi:hypothetical protein